MGMTEDDKRNCCLVEIQETEAKYYKTLEDIEKVSVQHVNLSSICMCGNTANEHLHHCLRCNSSVSASGLWIGCSMEMSAESLGSKNATGADQYGLLLAQPPQDTLIPGALSIDRIHYAQGHVLN